MQSAGPTGRGGVWRCSGGPVRLAGLDEVPDPAVSTQRRSYGPGISLLQRLNRIRGAGLALAFALSAISLFAYISVRRTVEVVVGVSAGLMLAAALADFVLVRPTGAEIRAAQRAALREGRIRLAGVAAVCVLILAVASGLHGEHPEIRAGRRVAVSHGEVIRRITAAEYRDLAMDELRLVCAITGLLFFGGMVISRSAWLAARSPGKATRAAPGRQSL